MLLTRCDFRNISLIWNIPVSATGLAAPLPVPKAELPDGSRQGNQNPRSNASPGYRGPCAPPSISHGYTYELFALDQKLDQPPGATRADFLSATDGYIVGDAVLVGLVHQ